MRRELQVLQLAQRGCGTTPRKGGQDSRPGFDQPYPCGRWIDTAKFPLQGVTRNLRKRAGEFNTGRPSADDHETQPGLALTAAERCLRIFKGTEHAAPNLERVVQCLQSRCITRPAAVAEIRMSRTSRYHEVVVIVKRVGEDNLPGFKLYPRDLPHRTVTLRCRRKTCRSGAEMEGAAQTCRRYLIKQRLKGVVITSVDQQNLGRRATQCTYRRQAREATADNNDSGQATHGCMLMGRQVPNLYLECLQIHDNWPVSRPHHGLAHVARRINVPGTHGTLRQFQSGGQSSVNFCGRLLDSSRRLWLAPGTAGPSRKCFEGRITANPMAVPHVLARARAPPCRRRQVVPLTVTQ